MPPFSGVNWLSSSTSVSLASLGALVAGWLSSSTSVTRVIISSIGLVIDIDEYF